jgi:hypothetical protein
MNMKIPTFWDAYSFSPIEVYQRFVPIFMDEK